MVPVPTRTAQRQTSDVLIVLCGDPIHRVSSTHARKPQTETHTPVGSSGRTHTQPRPSSSIYTMVLRRRSCLAFKPRSPRREAFETRWGFISCTYIPPLSTHVKSEVACWNLRTLGARTGGEVRSLPLPAFRVASSLGSWLRRRARTIARSASIAR